MKKEQYIPIEASFRSGGNIISTKIDADLNFFSNLLRKTDMHTKKIWDIPSFTIKKID